MQKEVDAVLIMKLILNFLQLLMPQTLAKRITSMVLIAVGIPNERVTKLTGLCDRQEKYGIKVCLNTVSNLLKKTASSG